MPEKPKTLRGYDQPIQDAHARVFAVLHRDTPTTNTEWIAYYRDLIAAREDLRDLYDQAGRVARPVGGAVWHAFDDATAYQDTRIQDAQVRINRLLRTQPKES
ncbi:hypothetical protein JOF41_007314 [Saccharothrix coeruleofusca]|uniref:hypothetical protein n=1 Tax=Saccharothrix coeruleofusca TaxID=33919 RepID=UPI001AE19F01|nr:hypothetical protein [Saccharothrix coeruleofusca]MBP2341060.1 hypothetical protein [Saccharothrix coeruleofusca]